MRFPALLSAILLAVLALAAGAAPSAPPAAPAPASPEDRRLAAELLVAADSVLYAPPDLKRQLAKHGDRLMQGVKDAAAAESGARDAAAHRAAAARGARAAAKLIRDRRTFAELAYELGGIVHELSVATSVSDASARPTRFLGYSAAPFQDPETLAAAALPAKTPAESYDAALTLTTRLLAWIWKNVGGDVRVVAEFPDAKGPYVVRE